MVLQQSCVVNILVGVGVIVLTTRDSRATNGSTARRVSPEDEINSNDS